ncbi:MAG: pseudouridine synthase [Erythrobacter sp.]
MPTQPPKSPDRPEGDRIAKLLARSGVASRREIERMIADKRITLDGKVVETPATFLTSLKGVSVDGKPVAGPEPTQLVAFHKPTGLITAERDMAGRPTIYAALANALPKDAPRLMPIGRLDMNTEGLLLLTNDGGLKRRMELPSSGIPRTYRARAFGEVSQDQLESLIEGVEIDGMRYGSIDANLERGGSGSGSGSKNHWIEMTITEGKNREVRRVLEYLDLQVNRLIRTSYGPFVLGDLPRGQAARIRKGDLDRFVSQMKRDAKQ